MANSNLVFMVSSSSFLIALLFFNGTFSALGRPLRTEDKGQVMTTDENSSIDHRMATVAKNTNADWRRYTLDGGSGPDSKSDAIGNWTDDFRPTDPGHSPGAGHSAPHANVAVPKP